MTKRTKNLLLSLVTSVLAPLLLVVPLVVYAGEKYAAPKPGLAGLAAGHMVLFGGMLLWAALALLMFSILAVYVWVKARSETPFRPVRNWLDTT